MGCKTPPEVEMILTNLQHKMKGVSAVGMSRQETELLIFMQKLGFVELNWVATSKGRSIALHRGLAPKIL